MKKLWQMLVLALTVCSSVVQAKVFTVVNHDQQPLYIGVVYWNQGQLKYPPVEVIEFAEEKIMKVPSEKEIAFEWEKKLGRESYLFVADSFLALQDKIDSLEQESKRIQGIKERDFTRRGFINQRFKFDRWETLLEGDLSKLLQDIKDRDGREIEYIGASKFHLVGGKSLRILSDKEFLQEFPTSIISKGSLDVGQEEGGEKLVSSSSSASAATIIIPQTSQKSNDKREDDEPASKPVDPQKTKDGLTDPILVINGVDERRYARFFYKTDQVKPVSESAPIYRFRPNESGYLERPPSQFRVDRELVFATNAIQIESAIDYNQYEKQELVKGINVGSWQGNIFNLNKCNFKIGPMSFGKDIVISVADQSTHRGNLYAAIYFKIPESEGGIKGAIRATEVLTLTKKQSQQINRPVYGGFVWRLFRRGYQQQVLVVVDEKDKLKGCLNQTEYIDIAKDEFKKDVTILGAYVVNIADDRNGIHTKIEWDNRNIEVKKQPGFIKRWLFGIIRREIKEAAQDL